MVSTSSTVHGIPPTQRPASFAAALRAATWSAHGQAEAGGAMTSLIDGSGDEALYVCLLTQLQFVYAELESVAEVMRADPIAADFAAAELTRLPSLHADLSALAGPDWASRAIALPPTVRYVQRLHEVARDWSGAFVAHHYTRYLGDLSGGLAVGAAVRRHLGLTQQRGAQFFTFDEIDNPAAFKTRYRELLDAAPWSVAEQQEIAEETIRAYRLNTELNLAVLKHAARPADTADTDQ